jgi:hypothetical protein
MYSSSLDMLALHKNKGGFRRFGRRSGRGMSRPSTVAGDDNPLNAPLVQGCRDAWPEPRVFAAPVYRA